MSSPVKILEENINADDLWNDINNLLRFNDLWDKDQISLTSLDGDNDWISSAGKIKDLALKERFYREINKDLIGTSIEKLIKKYKNFYRWRLMKLDPRSNYSIHSDGVGIEEILNARIHVPVKTNDDCYLGFFDKNRADLLNAEFYNLKKGNVYLCNTTRYHSAINFSEGTRWHIVGVSYEDSTNWA